MALGTQRLLHRVGAGIHAFDYLRHVNNIAYITWTETLRCEYTHDVLFRTAESAYLVFDTS